MFEVNSKVVFGFIAMSLLFPSISGAQTSTSKLSGSTPAKTSVKVEAPITEAKIPSSNLSTTNTVPSGVDQGGANNPAPAPAANAAAPAQASCPNLENFQGAYMSMLGKALSVNLPSERLANGAPLIRNIVEIRMVSLDPRWIVGILDDHGCYYYLSLENQATMIAVAEQLYSATINTDAANEFAIQSCHAESPQCSIAYNIGRFTVR